MTDFQNDLSLNINGGLMQKWIPMSPFLPKSPQWTQSSLAPMQQRLQHSTPLVEKKRRGRKSSLPPQEREINRRLKKRDVERKRRAFMLDKMNALQDLTLSVLGQESDGSHRLEKAELLDLYHRIMKTVLNVMERDDHFAKAIRTEIRRQSFLQQTKLDAQLSDLSIEKHMPTDEGIVDVETTIDSNEDDENGHLHSGQPAFQTFQSTYSLSSSCNLLHSQSHSITYNSQTKSASNGRNVWRPYL